jgi:hypothetical protein
MLLGVAALLILGAGAVGNELLGPVIRAVPIAAPDPLTICFAVFNPAFTVTLKNLDMVCRPLRLEGRDRNGKSWTARGQDFPLNVDIDVGPRMAFEYTCPIKDTGFTGTVDRVNARIALHYTRFGRSQQAISDTLSWDRISRTWTLASP